METIQIIINGQNHNVRSRSSLAEIIEQLLLPALGCVFAINNCVIPRSEWSSTHLNDGDAISLFQAIAGG
ncbi:sulfur carrier protein ThiS [Vibrio japonicus]|uniref:Sulfur carrier protein ThiS n=1 Tax=Vibrio japonicus TaxID=1824638 RepID=A0ABY5LHM1_9VIBR|nr:sulfur carrier protein ThiS [Vibrio japonicus]UUM30582.1 sulfur carrier protein ThiS [Vibrio japonicus]